MIQVTFEGKTWPEVTEQLAALIDEPQRSANDGELIALRNQLTDAFNTIEEKNARIAELEQRLATPAEEAPDENPTVAADSAPKTSEPAAPIEQDTVKDDVPDTATSEPERPKYDKATVREFLAEARNKGVNITEVLKPFGGRFPAVSEADYPALMEAAKKALAEKGAK